MSSPLFCRVFPTRLPPAAPLRIIMEILRAGSDRAAEADDASISTSIGIAVCPDDATDPACLAHPCGHRAL